MNVVNVFGSDITIQGITFPGDTTLVTLTAESSVLLAKDPDFRVRVIYNHLQLLSSELPYPPDDDICDAIAAGWCVIS